MSKLVPSSYRTRNWPAIRKALQDIEKRRREDALIEIEKVAQKHGVSMNDLVQPGTAKAQRPPKFRHPENPALTWSGRGRRPGWYKEAIKAGAKLEDLRTT